MRRYILVALILIVCSAAVRPLRAQEADTAVAPAEAVDSLHHSWFYHFLFDSTFASRVPVSGDSEHIDQIVHYVGGLTVIDIAHNAFAGEIADSNCMARFVDIRCSDEQEYTEIERSADDTVDVRIYQRDRSTGGKGGKPIFEHQFTADKTDEIRIHLRGEDDYAIARGSVASSIDVAVVGGSGNDELVDSSRVSGYLWHVLPIAKDQKKTYFFGEPNETNFVYSPSTVIDSKRSVFDDSDVAEPLARDWGHAWHNHPSLGFTTDDGAIIGAGGTLIEYGFREIPSFMTMSLDGAFATKAKHYDVQLNTTFYNVLGGELLLDAHASTLGRLGFFGYGNETTLESARYDTNDYRLNERVISFAPTYKHSIVENTSLWGSAAIRSVNVEGNPYRDSTFLKRRHDYGVGTLNTIALSYGGVFDSRNGLRAPTSGLYAAFSGEWVPEVLDNTYAYTRLHADIRGYLTAELGTPVTLALRADVEKIFGEHPFNESAFLGSATMLRGYYRDRFAGVQSLLASADLRIQIARVHVFEPTTIGVLGFFDAGRVYVDNDFSNTWHTSVGGGLWFAPVTSEHTVALTLAHSSEATQIYLTTGFAF